MLFTQDRQRLRAFFAEVLRKAQAGAVLEPLEAVAADIVRQHPEFHDLLQDPDALQRDYGVEEGNPFMHLSLHVALQEQVSADRPAGVRAVYQALLRRLQDPHEAQHRMMECLIESLWQAMQQSRPPDETGYLECLRRAASRPL